MRPIRRLLDRLEHLAPHFHDEGNLALWAYVRPGKYDYGLALRANLTRLLEEEG